MGEWEKGRSIDEQIEVWQDELVSVESEIARLRFRQIELIRRLDKFQVDTAEGSRTMGEWTSAHLDLSSQTSNRLYQVARACDFEIDQSMEAGKWGLDRAAALVKLRAVGIGTQLFDEAANDYSLGRLYGLLDRLRQISASQETEDHAWRYLVIQPSLDEGVFKLWGSVPGVDGRIIEKALGARETEFPVVAGEGQGQRRADALTSICLDSLTGTDGEIGRAVTVAEVFVDANLGALSYGEQGATLASGPRVGPNTLAEILCGGTVRVVLTDGLRLLAYSDMGDTIPPAVRSFVLWRDQGQCSIEGCRSRYRVQPHHIVERHLGGRHHPENLISLCWYHHHVAIHQMGFRIDPSSPPHRRRLLEPGSALSRGP